MGAGVVVVGVALGAADVSGGAVPVGAVVLADATWVGGDPVFDRLLGQLLTNSSTDTTARAVPRMARTTSSLPLGSLRADGEGVSSLGGVPAGCAGVALAG